MDTKPLLNRIYIVIGLLAIIVLAGAFVAPRFIQWSDYRDRMQVLASGVLGTDVAIRGEIEFSLLPQPQLHFTDVVVGDAEAPAATVGRVDAEFSLMDFLRDNYRVTKLVLDGPVVDLTIDADGLLGSGLDLQNADTGGNVSLVAASVRNGRLRLTDQRAGQTYIADKISGDLKLGSLTGPFQFQGDLNFDQQRYSARFNSAAADGDGSNRVSGYLEAANGVSISADGVLMAGIAPRFEGVMSYRQKPEISNTASGIRGDLVFASKVSASTDRVALTGYTLQPDENRAAMRLTGTANIKLGTHRSFDAVVSGGVFSLPPRPASEDLSQQPYDVVRLLSELPAPPRPQMPGRVQLDLGEIGLRSLALRRVRLDAHTDGQDWAIDTFTAKLPGDTGLELNGILRAEDGHSEFAGQLAMRTERLDAVGQMWRKGGEVNPLFGLSAALSGKIMLAGDALGLSEGVFTLNKTPHSLGLRIGFGRERRLDITGKFGNLSPRDSAALAALMPDVLNNPQFGNSFPQGSFSLTSQLAEIGGLTGRDLVAEGQWLRDQISFSRLAAQDWGGLGFASTLNFSGDLLAPQIWGKGTFRAQEGDAPGLVAVLDRLGISADLQSQLGRSVPADLEFDLETPASDGAQSLSLKGQLGSAKLIGRAQIGSGLLKAGSGALKLSATLESDTPDALATQIGFGDLDLMAPEGTMFVSAGLDGQLGDGFGARLHLSVGDDRLGYVGEISRDELGAWQGKGRLDGQLSDASGLARVLGADGLNVPGGTGHANIEFSGARSLQLHDIEGVAGTNKFAGNLSLTRSGGTGIASGKITLDTLNLGGMTASLVGPAGLMTGAGDVWPDGPIDIGRAERSGRGLITISAPTFSIDGDDRFSDARFELQWDSTRLRISRFAASQGEGQIRADISLCCSDSLASKTLSGRLNLSDMQLADILPAALAENLGGIGDAGVQFSGTGASLADIARNMTGEGRFSISDLVVRHFDPRVFPAITRLDNLLETNAGALAALVAISLDQGPFVASGVEGAFTIAGGVLRLANLSMEGALGQIAGDTNLSLEDLGLEGRFVLTPRNLSDEQALFTGGSAEIVAQLTGTLLAPIRELGLDGLIASVQLRANEIELARLEKLRAEDAARQKEAAAARNALIAAQKKRDAEAKAAADAKAAEAEKQRQQQAQDAAPGVEPAPPPQLQEPLDLGLPAPVLPLGDGVNQPIARP